MPEITGRSSTRLAPGWFLGRRGSIAIHASSNNQNSTMSHLPVIHAPPQPAIELSSRLELTPAPADYGLSTVSLNGPALAAACATASLAPVSG
jgi:hypothetical protein